MRYATSTLVIALVLVLGTSFEVRAGKGANSKDDLFQLDEEDERPSPPPEQANKPPAPESKKSHKRSGSGIRWSGFLQEEVARSYKVPSHWSKVLTRGQLVGQGQLTSGAKWKLSGRLNYDAVFDLTNHYPDSVRKDRRLDLLARENYIDFTAKGLDFRLGRQHIIWGEMVGLFFADVVSARDTRDFILPEFEIQRVPQWAVRAEHFKNDWHSELIWIPYASVDRFGELGDDFFPTLISASGLGLQTRPEVKPTRSLRNSNGGLRIGVIRNGWDLAGFYYSSIDASPHFTRNVETSPTPTVVYTPRHNRIWQSGGTLAKDFGTFVMKGEVIYARDKHFSVTDFSDADGVVKQNLLDYVLGVEFGMREQDVKFNLQAFQRVFLNHVDSLIPKKRESGASLLAIGKFGDFAPQLLVIHSLNRSDRLLRPSMDWSFAKNLRLRAGVDIFSGPTTGLFGQYANRDRAYIELKYNY